RIEDERQYCLPMRFEAQAEDNFVRCFRLPHTWWSRPHESVRGYEESGSVATSGGYFGRLLREVTSRGYFGWGSTTQGAPDDIKSAASSAASCLEKKKPCA